MKRVPTAVEINTFNLLKWLWALTEETDRVIVTLNEWEKDFDVYVDVSCFADFDEEQFNRFTRISIEVTPDGYTVTDGLVKTSSRSSLLDVQKRIVKAISDDTDDYSYTIDI